MQLDFLNFTVLVLISDVPMYSFEAFSFEHFGLIVFNVVLISTD